MIRTLIIFAPLFVCVFWIIVHRMIAPRTESHIPFMILLLVTSIAVFANSILSEDTTSA